MRMIMNSLHPNEYIRNCKETIFTVLLRETLLQNQNVLENLTKFDYIHGLLSYPPRWLPTTDIFCYIKDDALIKLQNKKSYFIFDSSTEGFSPIYEFPFFDMLYFNCKKYNVDPSMIIFVSSNLRDEKNLENYSKEKNLKPINVFSFLSFEQVITIDEGRKEESIKLQFETTSHFVKTQFKDKYFSSLSRVYRQFRSVGTFLLCQSEISNKALISHGLMPKNIIPEIWLSSNNLNEYNKEHFSQWIDSLPLTVDQSNFDINWAINTPYRHIHDQTLFQIVNETLVQDWERTTLFYSEKSFRPIACFQPFVIWGQQGCNKYLENVGYKNYSEWFDLSFDDEPDNILRYKKLLVTITDTCKMLDSMTRDEKIEWRFKNKELLIDNFTTMVTSSYSRKKLLGFVTKICNDLS